MTGVSSCVICGGAIRRVKRALVAPFLATRIWGRAPFCVDLVRCAACGFLFYNPRLDPAEEARLYGGYRSEEYQRMRQASEPWYTERFNADLASPASYELRRRTLREILRQHIGSRKIRRVLDYGGDHGDLVQGLFDGAEAFVYDISGVAPVTGVTATADPSSCGPDLVINSNVLEHVAYPRRMAQEVLKTVPPGGLAFLEVPSETPFGLPRIARRIAQIGIMSLMRPGLALSVVRPAGLYLMHEHVNYYTERSLGALMSAGGCEVIASGSYAVDVRSGKGTMVWCLGAPAAPPS